MRRATAGLRRNGGAEGDRTLDLRIANATLSQLSYRPTRGRASYQRLQGWQARPEFIDLRPEHLRSRSKSSTHEVSRNHSINGIHRANSDMSLHWNCTSAHPARIASRYLNTRVFIRPLIYFGRRIAHGRQPLGQHRSGRVEAGTAIKDQAAILLAVGSRVEVAQMWRLLPGNR